MGNKKYIQIRQKIPIDSDGTVFKEFNANEKFRQQDITVMLKLLPLIAKYNLDFLPKIVDYNKNGYRYKFVDGKTIKEEFRAESTFQTSQGVIKFVILETTTFITKSKPTGKTNRTFYKSVAGDVVQKTTIFEKRVKFGSNANNFLCCY